MSRRAISFGIIGAAVLTLIGCGGTAKESAAVCEPVSAETTAWIAQGLNDGVSFVGSLSAVNSKDFEKVWMVAGKVNGDAVGVWSINTITDNSGTVYSVNKVAQTSSDWIRGDTIKTPIKESADGVAAVVKCVG